MSETPQTTTENSPPRTSPDSCYGPGMVTCAKCSIAEELFCHFNARSWQEIVTFTITHGLIFPDDIHFTVEVHEDFQGQGIGEEAVTTLLAIADRQRQRVTLQIDGKSKDPCRLERWYRRHQFVRTGTVGVTGGAHMTRVPRGDRA